MTLVLETGTGIRGANAYANGDYVLAYLTERGRENENSFATLTSAQRDIAAIKATQYLDVTNAGCIRGVRLTKYQGAPAQAIIGIQGLPADGETIVISSTEFTFVVTESLLGKNEVVISGSVSELIDGLIEAINSDGLVSASEYEDGTDQILLEALVDGESGNDTPLATTASLITIDAAWQNGEDQGSQPLMFPRLGLVDLSGNKVIGIPRDLKWAMSEYAVRTPASELFVTPNIDASGRAVTKKQIGPLVTEWGDSSSIAYLYRPIPHNPQEMMFLKLVSFGRFFSLTVQLMIRKSPGVQL